MLQLVYISSARPGIAVEDVRNILSTSRARNAGDRVTGVLVFNGKRFLQALEGDPSAVEAAFTRIRADDRHRAVVKLSERQVEAREFGDWAMASCEVAGHGNQAAMIETVDALVAKVPDANTRETFRSFVRIARAA